MKKIFLLLILFLFIKGFGQTYSLNLHVYVTKGTASINSNVGSVYTFTNTNNYGSQDYPFLTTVKGNSFTFNLTTNSGACSQNLSVTKSLLELLRDNFTLQSCSTGSGYAGNFYPISFIPNNITITNRNLTTEVCSGEQLELDANSPNIFPNEVYHWQYSLDNKAYWADVPAAKNNSPSTKFSINDFLSANIHNYFDKIIYFRLGYGQSKQFTTPLGITFKACAPIIKDLKPIPPNCSGDAMSVIITFDRSLDATKNEKLTYLQIIKKTGEVTLNQIEEISEFDSSNPLQYTYKNITGLEDNSTYTVKYQAFQGIIERGVPTTDKDFNPTCRFYYFEWLKLC